MDYEKAILSYLCYNFLFTWIENLYVRFKMFYLNWLQYFFDIDTWQANTLLYSASVTEALFSPFWFSNFMTLWKGRDQYLNMT